ncbi:RNA polymerase sigma-70 factor, ECF subfamily [Roseovarius nanhaiticus]|uniref:RNA polymerase sigma-70 factor, ECF subfamily n=1 Tax=Roseovarius nanhaiticus TaxID=573024 RepID=A0A1N7GDN7_9RHOB|nr:sigma-70 family RNA polymerase sigma factor [Roseovarius nanhaiticus]SEK29552.1 RNA polymerase sigma-70 factor, ECF subfamily [Roseovarius nanhaiticus]SIS10681.1 RNA polymerase sigma-70 factor, ECF subfamily [Roseovarius nanhaiticus]
MADNNAAAANPALARLEDLIARCALKDRAAFAELYDASCGKLFAVCLRILRTRAAAEDAMQEAYIKIWKNADRYRVTGHSPMTWLITIARNTAIDHVRARRDDKDMADYQDIVPAPGATPEQSAIAASEAGRIGACLSELPQDRRAAITGAYLEGRSYAELAERAAVPLNTMRTWLRRGLSALRECMSQ